MPNTLIVEIRNILAT